MWEALSAASDAGRPQVDASAESDGRTALAPSDDSARAQRPEIDPAHLPAERADALVSLAQAYLTHSPRTLGSGDGNLSVAVRDGRLEFHNRYGLKLELVPARSHDFEAIEHWLQTTEPGFDSAGTPVWDGSRLHLGMAIDSLLRAQSSRDHARC